MMVTLREAILDALADDGESIIQIGEYLTYLSIEHSKNDIIQMLNILFVEGMLQVAYPEDFKAKSLMQSKEIDEFWFELTVAGRLEWDKIIP